MTDHKTGHTPEIILANFLENTPPRRIGVAVSGGGDSVALMYLLADWSKAHAVKVLVATVDHGLRPEAAHEARLVLAQASQLGLDHEILRWNDWDNQGNLQAEARAARYRLLGAWGQKKQLDVILLGHTEDDLAETLLLRLARRAGIDGLSAMAPHFRRDGQDFGRPLLAVPREVLRDTLRQRDVNWIEDPSNSDPRFDRVRARRALEHLETLGIDAAALADVSRNLGDARRALNAQTTDWARAHVSLDRGDIVMPFAAFTSLAAEFQRRVLSAALIWISGAAYAPRGEALGRLLADLAAGSGGTLHGCLVTTPTTTPTATTPATTPASREIRIAREYAAVLTAASSTPDWDRWHLSGPWVAGLQVRALGPQGLRALDDWRACGLPRASLMASPSVWQGDRLIAAPHAGFTQGWEAKLVTERAIFLTLTG